MKTLISVVFILQFATVQATASARTETFFLDGTKVEYESFYTDGRMDVSLPEGMIKDSLRIKPDGGSVILRVEMHGVGTDRKADKEIASLEERRSLLADRIRTLDSKERIFTAAAKSQSGRALRKTRNNPEPLADIRRGTAFAVAQLESAIGQRRKLEKELVSTEEKLSSLRNAKGMDRVACSVWFSRKSGRARILYLTTDRNWKPIYDFRLDGAGNIRIVMKALFGPVEKDSAVFVKPVKLSDPDYDSCVPVPVSSQYDKVGEFSFAVENQVLSQTPVNSISFSFINGSGQKLPPGDATCFLQGEYLGGLSFKGAACGQSVAISAGNISRQ